MGGYFCRNMRYFGNILAIPIEFVAVVIIRPREIPTHVAILPHSLDIDLRLLVR
jgi:hypothetical protein